jgi:hypothetical protein
MLGLLEFLVEDDVFESVCRSYLHFIQMKVRLRFVDPIDPIPPKQIELGFLKVGHTHEDVDQFFGRAAQHVETHEARTPQSFLGCFESCVKTERVTAEYLPTVFDLKSWIGPSLNNLEGHSRPHYFLWFKDCSGQVKMFSKENSGDEWSASPKVLFSMPTGSPDRIKPNPAPLADFTKTLHRLSPALTQEEILSWRTWAESIRTDQGRNLALNEIPKTDVRVTTARPLTASDEEIIKRLKELIGQ